MNGIVLEESCLPPCGCRVPFSPPEHLLQYLTPWKLPYVTPAPGARYRAGREGPEIFLWLCGAAAEAGFWQPRAAACLAAATLGTPLSLQPTQALRCLSSSFLGQAKNLPLGQGGEKNKQTQTWLSIVNFFLIFFFLMMAVGSCSKVWAVAVPARWQRTDETEVPCGCGVRGACPTTPLVHRATRSSVGVSDQ